MFLNDNVITDSIILSLLGRRMLRSGGTVASQIVTLHHESLLMYQVIKYSHNMSRLLQVKRVHQSSSKSGLERVLREESISETSWRPSCCCCRTQIQISISNLLTPHVNLVMRHITVPQD